MPRQALGLERAHLILGGVELNERPFALGQLVAPHHHGKSSCSPHAALALDRKKLAAFSALGGGFLRFPIGDRRCNRTRASVGNAGGNARPSLTNANG